MGFIEVSGLRFGVWGLRFGGVWGLGLVFRGEWGGVGVSFLVGPLILFYLCVLYKPYKP